MNSRYWRKILIKLLNLTNSVYNLNNNGSETEKSGIKSTLWNSKACLAADHVVTQAVWGKRRKANCHVSRLARKPHWHVST